MAVTAAWTENGTAKTLALKCKDIEKEILAARHTLADSILYSDDKRKAQSE